MKIQYASDLHLEFRENTKYLMSNPLKVTGDILILGGDIHVMDSPYWIKNPFWDWLSENYKKVIVAFGNHEFYGGYDLARMEDGFKYKIRDNIYYYYNCIIKLDDVDIIISTLWSYIYQKNEISCRFGVNDFHLIKYNGHLLTPKEFNNEHKKCFDFIKKSMNESKAKTKIIVTHHVPSDLLNAKEFEGSDINNAFTVDLTDYIKSCGAKYWIFGHSHRNINKKIGETYCLCNQLGYLESNENKTFNPEEYIDINEDNKNKNSE